MRSRAKAALPCPTFPLPQDASAATEPIPVPVLKNGRTQLSTHSRLLIKYTFFSCNLTVDLGFSREKISQGNSLESLKVCLRRALCPFPYSASFQLGALAFGSNLMYP